MNTLLIEYLKFILNGIGSMGNKYNKSFSDAFKMYLEIFPRQATLLRRGSEESIDKQYMSWKFKCISNIFDSLVVI